MEYVGHAPPGSYDNVVFRGDVAGRQFIAFWLRENRALAAMAVNTWDVIDEVTAIVREGTILDIHRLTDADVPLSAHLQSEAKP